MKKLISTTVIVAFLAACSAEQPASEAPAVSPYNTTETIEAEIAANAVDPVTESGKTVNLEALKAAFTAAGCAEDKPVQNASCKVGDKPGEYRCDYSLRGDNVFSMKNTVIVEDGDNWKFIEVPNHCKTQ